MPSPPNPDKQDSDQNRDSAQGKSFWLQFARYSQLAFALPAATLVGWLAGAGLDRWLHTHWLYLVGILLGIVAGFVELIRTALRDTR